MANKLVSVDPGKHTCKAFTINNDGKPVRSAILNKLSEVANAEDFELHGESYLVSEGSNNYVIGDQGENINFDISKTSISHKIAVYASLSKLLVEDDIIQNTKIDIVLGCPISIYLNKNLRDRYKEYIIGNGQLQYLVNKIPYRLHINNVFVLPEGSGVTFTHHILFKSKRTAVIDLGGLNMNFAIYNSFVPEQSSMFSLNHGYFHLENSIVKSINSKYGLTLNSQDAFYIVNQGGIKIKGAVVAH